MNCAPVTFEELRQIRQFSEDEPAAIEWLRERFVITCHEAGETIIEEGDPVNEMMVILEGEMHFRREQDPYANLFVRTPGQFAGVLPFSRMKQARGRGWAVLPLRVARLHQDHFRELVYRAPRLAQMLVWEMMDRTRESTQMDERSSRMLALGKLSAGLAHELNNPAAAAVRSSVRLREVLLERRHAAMGLQLPPEAQAIFQKLNDELSECVDEPEIDALERSDIEASLGDFFAEHSIETSPALPDTLAGAGVTPQCLLPLPRIAPPDALARGLRVLAADYELLCLTREVEEAARRISDLVQAVKTYSYMDRAPLATADIEPGLKVTLRMFQHQLKHGVTLVKSFHGDLPKIPGNGGALNQVWTNLIDNALDATEGQPARELQVRTALQPGEILVEIGDNGPGIPDDVRARIFEPFFTTKPVGEGTGLGLDIVQRIIVQHKGSIRVESRPGRTVFQVRLPVS